MFVSSMAVSRGYATNMALAGLFLTLAWLPQMTEAKWVEGTVRTNSDWIFLARFCFLSREGKMDYFLEYPVGFGVESMLFYYDVPGQWPSVYQRNKTCQEKVKVVEETNVFPLLDQDSMCVRERRVEQDWYVCSGEIDFNSARERWWFVVLSKCNSSNSDTTAMYLHYKIHMTNGHDLLHKEFSADEFYIVVVDILFLGLYLVLTLASIVCAVILKSKQLLHATYKMYFLSVIIWTISLLCSVIAWLYYGVTGYTIGSLETIGRILQMCSNVVLILMLVLVAKGYTVVRYSLTRSALVKVTVFMLLYITAMVVMFVWENILFDPGLVMYYYESPPGYGMITVVLIGWLWFTKSAVFTLKHHSARTRFYVVFYTVYTIWFWASPVVVLIAMFAMAKWTREKTVNGVQQTIEFLGHLFFLVITLPYKANSNFPYHTRAIETKPGSDRNKHYWFDDDNDIVNKNISFPKKGPNMDVITKSRNLAEDEENSGKMYINADLIMPSDGTFSPNVCQTTDPDKILPYFDNISIDGGDCTRVRDDRLSNIGSPVQLKSFHLEGLDECGLLIVTLPE